MVKELGVAGVHPPTARACHHLLLGVAAQVLPQLRTPFSSGFAICGATGSELGLNNPTFS